MIGFLICVIWIDRRLHTPIAKGRDLKRIIYEFVCACVCVCLVNYFVYLTCWFICWWLCLGSRDVILYALGVGACARDAVDENELKYVYHEDGQQLIQVFEIDWSWGFDFIFIFPFLKWENGMNLNLLLYEIVASRWSFLNRYFLQFSSNGASQWTSGFQV